MKNKIGIALIAVLFVASSAAAATGYIYDSKRVEKNPNLPNNENKITYEYYLEDELQEQMPVNPDITNEDGTVTKDNVYRFSRYVCTNDVTGEFNNETWTFTPSEEKESNCSLYFVNSFYDVTLDVRGGVAADVNPIKVERESDRDFIITPDEGHEFKEVTCTNGKEAKWDQSTNTLNISAITENLACTVIFGTQDLKVDITVKNGNGTTTETAGYGESVSAIVQPSEGYGNPKIECTNNQQATFADNKLSIEKLTDSTKCTVTFSEAAPSTYKLSIINIPNEVTITQGSNGQDIQEGKDGGFTLKPADGYDLALDCGGVAPSSTTVNSDGSITYNFLAIKNNITCSVTASLKTN